MNLANEFCQRCIQLKLDHKPLYNIIEISLYEFSKFIQVQEVVNGFTIYSFDDGSICKREFSNWIAD